MISLALLLAFAAAPCDCPPIAVSRDQVLVAAEERASRGEGFVVCGYSEERRAEVVVASEFEIFRCGGDKPILTFGAIDTALLRQIPSGLDVTEVANWPFGADWSWIEVPIYRWQLAYGATAAPERSVVLTPPAISKERLDALYQWYGDLVRQPAETRAEQTEEAVGRVFAAALADDRFRPLFKDMREALALDGISAEIYNKAEALLASYTGTP